MKLIRRKVDQLGRVVIPSDIREVLQIHEGDEVGFELLPDGVKLVKYDHGCCICGRTTMVVDIEEGKRLCLGCVRKAQKAFEFDDIN